MASRRRAVRSRIPDHRVALDVVRVSDHGRRVRRLAPVPAQAGLHAARPEGAAKLSRICRVSVRLSSALLGRVPRRLRPTSRRTPPSLEMTRQRSWEVTHPNNGRTSRPLTRFGGDVKEDDPSNFSLQASGAHPDGRPMGRAGTAGWGGAWFGRVAVVVVPSALTAAAFIVGSRFDVVGNLPVWVLLGLLVVMGLMAEVTSRALGGRSS